MTFERPNRVRTAFNHHHHHHQPLAAAVTTTANRSCTNECGSLSLSFSVPMCVCWFVCLCLDFIGFCFYHLLFSTCPKNLCINFEWQIFGVVVSLCFLVWYQLIADSWMEWMCFCVSSCCSIKETRSEIHFVDDENRFYFLNTHCKRHDLPKAAFSCNCSCSCGVFTYMRRNKNDKKKQSIHKQDWKEHWQKVLLARPTVTEWEKKNYRNLKMTEMKISILCKANECECEKKQSIFESAEQARSIDVSRTNKRLWNKTDHFFPP